MRRLVLSHIKNKRYTGNNLGLHCHCAETKEKLLELLDKAKKENVGCLVINNYKRISIYTQILPMLSDKELEKFKGMKIIPSMEMPGYFNFTNLDGQNYNLEVHIIGYGVDIEYEDVLKEFCSQKYKTINQEEELKRLISIGHNLGLNFKDEDVYLDYSDDKRKYAGRAFTQALLKHMDDNFCKKHESNKNKLPYELRNDWRGFHNVCVKDINGPFYLDLATLNPEVSEVIDLIHKMGGRAHLAHPSAYFAKKGDKNEIEKAYKNIIKFASDFMEKFSPKNNKNTHIDGFEIYHPSYMGNIHVMSEIKELINQHRLASSGGTDIHFDQTLGNNEKVSDDGLGHPITKHKLKRFRKLREKAIEITSLRKKAIELMNNEKER